MVSQYGQELVVGRDDGTLRQIRDLWRSDMGNIEADVLAAQTGNTIRHIKGDAVHRIDDSVQSTYNGRYHCVYKADDVVDGGLDTVGDDIPDA